jgi:hypothetical protein
MAEQAAADPALHGFGTTMTMALSLGEDLLVAHLGDSRAYLLPRQGLHRLTRDHTVAQALADQGLFARRLAAFRGALLSAGTEDDLRAVTAELLRRARDGDVLAMRLLFAYVIGRPTDAVDPDTLDQQERDIYRRHPARGEGILDLLQTLPPQMACFLVRTTLPHIGNHFGQMLRAQLEAQRAAEAGAPANPANPPGG